MKIAILTSSRSDFGIYLPLLKKLVNDDNFELEIIAFGPHLSLFNGYTISEIEKFNFPIIHKIPTMLSGDDEESIATSYSITCLKFSNFWNNHKYKLVLCLGDRFEMSAAVQAGIPFGINFAHIHGGETTLGAIDNIYRHQISLASKLHFTSTSIFSERVSKIIGTDKNIYNVGALSLNDIEKFIPMNKNIFFETYNISKEEYILITLHPETININENLKNLEVFFETLKIIIDKYFLVITMPNADTMNSIFIDRIIDFKNKYPNNLSYVENFGKENYFNALYYCKAVVGNSSSGIIEAASFKKFVINIGNRQSGRLQSSNVYNVSFEKNEILQAVELISKNFEFNGENLYLKNNTVELIIEKIKEFNEIV